MPLDIADSLQLGLNVDTFDEDGRIQVETVLQSADHLLVPATKVNIGDFRPGQVLLNSLAPTPGGIVRAEAFPSAKPKKSHVQGMSRVHSLLDSGTSSTEVMRAKSSVLDRAIIQRDPDGKIRSGPEYKSRKLTKVGTSRYSDPMGRTGKVLKSGAKVARAGARAGSGVLKGAAKRTRVGRKLVKPAKVVADATKRMAGVLNTSSTLANETDRFIGVRVDPTSPATRAGVVRYPFKDSFVDDAYARSVGRSPPAADFKESTSILQARKAKATEKRITSALTEAADRGLKGAKAERFVLKSVPEATGFITSAGRQRGGDVVNMLKKDLNFPKANYGKRVIGALPFVGGAIDIYEGVSDIAEGDLLRGLAHFADGALGMTGVGDIFNIGANLMGYDGAFTMLAEEGDELVEFVADAATPLASLELADEETIQRLNDPTRNPTGTLARLGGGGVTLL